MADSSIVDEVKSWVASEIVAAKETIFKDAPSVVNMVRSVEEMLRVKIDQLEKEFVSVIDRVSTIEAAYKLSGTHPELPDVTNHQQMLTAGLVPAEHIASMQEQMNAALQRQAGPDNERTKG